MQCAPQPFNFGTPECLRDPYLSNEPYQGFALFHVLLAKEELTVEV